MISLSNRKIINQSCQFLQFLSLNKSPSVIFFFLLKELVGYCVDSFDDSIEKDETKLHKICKSFLLKAEDCLKTTLFKTKISLDDAPTPIVLVQ
jgi:hypothetical protein